MANKPIPTTFLSLPRELRQQTLLHTYAYTELCKLPPPNVTFLYHEALSHWYTQQRQIIAWVQNLRQVHNTIEEDAIAFVGDKWDAALQKYWYEICESYEKEMVEYGTGEEGIARSLAFGEFSSRFLDAMVA